MGCLALFVVWDGVSAWLVDDSERFNVGRFLTWKGKLKCREEFKLMK
jgi:hypothetical protein